jgi:hypothetical protein
MWTFVVQASSLPNVNGRLEACSKSIMMPSKGPHAIALIRRAPAPMPESFGFLTLHDIAASLEQALLLVLDGSACIVFCRCGPPPGIRGRFDPLVAMRMMTPFDDLVIASDQETIEYVSQPG